MARRPEEFHLVEEGQWKLKTRYSIEETRKLPSDVSKIPEAEMMISVLRGGKGG